MLHVLGSRYEFPNFNLHNTYNILVPVHITGMNILVADLFVNSLHFKIR